MGNEEMTKQSKPAPYLECPKCNMNYPICNCMEFKKADGSVTEDKDG